MTAPGDGSCIAELAGNRVWRMGMGISGMARCKVICKTETRDQNQSKIENHETLAIALTQLKFQFEFFVFRVGSAM